MCLKQECIDDVIGVHEGSWVVMIYICVMGISMVTLLPTLLKILIALLLATHEPASIFFNYGVLRVLGAPRKPRTPTLLRSVPQSI